MSVFTEAEIEYLRGQMHGHLVEITTYEVTRG